MSDDGERISHQYRVTAKKWVAADAAASLLEESKSAFLAQEMGKLGDMPVSRAEMMIKGSDAWKAYIQSMVRAREQASLLKVQIKYIEMLYGEWQSENATRRAEMRL